MQIIKVNLKENPYRIIAGYGILQNLRSCLRVLKLGPDAYCITNKLIRDKYGAALNSSLKKCGLTVRFKLIPDTEKSKSLKVFSEVINDLARYDMGKNIFLVSFGGGVAGDLTGFIASVYKRGVPYVQIPTTLLAQVDSAIGGKTGIDLEYGKNLIGTFYQPRLVLSDIKFLKTLKIEQLRGALAEIIKYALIKDADLFRYLEKNYRGILRLKTADLEYVVIRCARIKAKIVEEDEREQRGLRTILNFGHTIGHAIEAAGNYRLYSHGDAVSLGMLIACRISHAKGLLAQGLLNRIEALIKNTGLPVKISGLRLKDIITAHYRDKKFSGKINKFVLIKGIGKTEIIKNLPLELIQTAIKESLS